MSIFRRIGTVRHKYKMEFFIKKVTVSKTLNGTVYISIKRGDHKINSQHQLPFEDKVCNFKNQVLTFQAITLFYDESEKKYQEKPGEIKVIMKTSKGEKKLLGLVPFDAAFYANNQGTKAYKQKKDLQQTPSKMTGQIQYQVFMECLGEASETSRSLAKDQKTSARDQSPFNKIANFFTGLVSSDERTQNHSKKGIVSPPKDNQDENSDDSKQQKQKRIGKKQDKGEKISSRKKLRQQNSQKETNSGINKRKKKNDEDDLENSEIHKKNKDKNKNNSDQQSQLFNYNPRPQSNKNSPVKQRTRKKKLQQQKQAHEGSEDRRKKIQVEQNINKKQKSKKQSSQIKPSTIGLEDKVSKHSKNLISQNYHQNFTQLSEQDKQVNKYAKSEAKKSVMDKEEFFFDDPDTFPQNYKKKEIVKKQSTNQQIFNEKQQNPSKNRKQIQENMEKIMNQKQKIENKYSNVEGSKGNRKVKENTINMETKNGSTNKQTKQKSQKNIFENDNKAKNVQKMQVVADRGIEKRTSKNYDLQNKLKKELKQDDLDNLLSQFAEQPPKNQTRISLQMNKKIKKQKEENDYREKKMEKKIDSSNAIEKQKQRQKQKQQKEYTDKLKQQLQEKRRQIMENKLKLLSLEEIRKKLKQTQDKKKQLQKINGQLKQASVKMERQLNRLKYQNQSLKSQSNKNQSFFRQTAQHYQQNNSEVDLQEDIKRLQRQKNEYMLNLQKEKQKNKKQIKLLTQQIEKQKIKYKDFEDLSKAELKKLKDEVMNKNGNVQAIKDKLKQKSKEVQTMLKQNQILNASAIQLKQKLANIKFKICEKLNEANQNGQPELMQVLTELNQQI